MKFNSILDKKEIHLLLFVVSVISLLIIQELVIPETVFGQKNEEKVIFSAMKDEMDRSMDILQMEDLEKPYYISYRIQENNITSISASFGAVLSSGFRKSRSLAADVRVGDYKFDNTNFSSTFSFGSGRLMTYPPTLKTDYDVLRHDLWRTTDMAYKSSLESLTKKRAAIQTQKIEDELDDLEKIKAEKRKKTIPFIKVNRDEWEKKLKKLSSIFKDYASIDETLLSLRTNYSRHYMLNTEGTEIHLDKFIITLDIFIAAQAGDGTKVTNARSFYARSFEDFPDEAQLKTSIEALAKETTALQSAPVLEDYEGPVLFSGEASGAFFAQLLPSKLSSNRGSISEDTRFRRRSSQGKLARKLNRRVAPDFLSATDIPLLTHINNMPLIGSYPFDDEGIVPAPLPIIENGILKNYYMSRTPTKRLKHTNGHGRSSIGSIPAGRTGNLIISAKDGLPYDKLKQEFIQLCREEGLEYGIIISRMMRPSQESATGRMGFSIQYPSYGGSELSNPAIAYKVYVNDGREELIRGFEIVGVKVRILKDILFAGNDRSVYNYTDSGSSGSIASSLVAPSIVIEEIELRQIQQELLKPPILANPYTLK